MFWFEMRLFEIWGKLQTFPPSKISDILRVGVGQSCQVSQMWAG
jgi:hypothetical protein